jgi:GPH family glycoside/pentoside/hexuronide:cation symporter
MYADTADYNEWRTGRRATAMTFAAATFSQSWAPPSRWR